MRGEKERKCRKDKKEKEHSKEMARDYERGDGRERMWEKLSKDWQQGKKEVRE